MFARVKARRRRCQRTCTRPSKTRGSPVMSKLTAACLLLLIATAGAAEKYASRSARSSTSRLQDISFVAAIRFGERRGLMLRRLICLFFSCLLASGGFGKSPSPENAADRLGLVDLMGRAADPRGDRKWRVHFRARIARCQLRAKALHAEFAPRKVAFLPGISRCRRNRAHRATHKGMRLLCAALRDPRPIFAQVAGAGRLKPRLQCEGRTVTTPNR